MGGTQHRSKKNHMMDPGYGGADMSGAIFDGANCRQAIFIRSGIAPTPRERCS